MFGDRHFDFQLTSLSSHRFALAHFLSHLLVASLESSMAYNISEAGKYLRDPKF